MELQEETRRNAWSQEWPDGTDIGGPTGIDPVAISAIRTARKLKHAVVVIEHDSKLHFLALPL
jgi:hypothetical protein